MVTSFTKQHCHLIMKLILKAGLPKAGVIHTYPRVLVHGPSCYVGLAIPNLYMEQLVLQICTVLHFGGQERDTMAMLIWASVEAMQLEMGLQGKFLDMPICVKHLVTDSWIKTFGWHAKNLRLEFNQISHSGHQNANRIWN